MSYEKAKTKIVLFETVREMGLAGSWRISARENLRLIMDEVDEIFYSDMHGLKRRKILWRYLKSLNSYGNGQIHYTVSVEKVHDQLHRLFKEILVILD